MLSQVVALLLLAAIASASLSNTTVIFHDPADYQAEFKCCTGPTTVPHRYDGEYLVSALYLSSHIRDYKTQESGPEQQDIRVSVAEYPDHGGGWNTVAWGNHSQVAGPLQLVRVPVLYQTKRVATYSFSVVYYGSYLYPVYWDMDISAGPFNTTYNYNAFILGIEYEPL